MDVNIQNLIDDAQCYKTVRNLRWPDGLRCVNCQSAKNLKKGEDETEPYRQRYQCRTCAKRFDDLTNTVFCRPSSAAKNMYYFPILYGIKPLERTNCTRAFY